MNFSSDKTSATLKTGLSSGNLRHRVQPKLEVNQPGDKYEQEADAMAEKVMRMPANGNSIEPVTGLIGASVQRCSACEEDEKIKKPLMRKVEMAGGGHSTSEMLLSFSNTAKSGLVVQRKCTACEEEEKKKKPLMRKTEAGNTGIRDSASFASSLNGSKGGGSPLSGGTKSFMENAFSRDFSSVRIHTNAHASEMSKNINAKAFTHGPDIYFKSGQFSPDNDEGKKLLSHELTHVLQQDGSIQRKMIQRREENNEPLSLVQGLAMYDLLKQLQNFPMDTLTDEEAGMAVSGVRLVLAMRAVIAKKIKISGTYIVNNQPELDTLPADQVDNIKSFLGILEADETNAVPIGPPAPVPAPSDLTPTPRPQVKIPEAPVAEPAQEAVDQSQIAGPPTAQQAQDAETARIQKLNDDYNKATDKTNPDWNQAASLLNGFSDSDIKRLLNKLSKEERFQLRNAAINQAIPRVADFILFIDITAETDRVGQLNSNYSQAIANGDWDKAAMYLNGFSDTDININLQQLTQAKRKVLRDGAVRNGYERIANAVEQFDFKINEEERLKKLKSDYDMAISSGKWEDAVTYLNAYNDDDIPPMLVLVNEIQLQNIKYAAVRTHNERISSFADKDLQYRMSSEQRIKQYAEGYSSAAWVKNFLEGFRNSGATAKLGESSDKLLDDLFTKNADEFKLGVTVGFPIGILGDLWNNIAGIFELSWNLVKLQVVLLFEPLKLLTEIQQILNALANTIVMLMDAKEVGLRTGVFLADSLKADFIDQKPYEQGKLIGKTAGMIITEIALLFVGVEEVSAVAKGMKGLKWGEEVGTALEKGRLTKVLMEANSGGKLVRDAETGVNDVGKLKQALERMAEVEKSNPQAVLKDMLKLEERIVKEELKDVSKVHNVKGDLAKDFDAEISVSNEHTYRHSREKPDVGKWCRFSSRGDCYVFGESAELHGSHVEVFPSQRKPLDGEWSGTPGNSIFTPHDNNAWAGIDYRGIPFKDGYPVFSRWRVGEKVLLPESVMNIPDRDLHFREADKILARRNNWLYQGKPNVAEAERYRSAQRLTWHHNEKGFMELIPRQIHEIAQHEGWIAGLP